MGLYDSTRIFRLHCWAIMFLLACNTLINMLYFTMGYDHILGIFPAFDVNKEWNVPSIFSALAILFCSLTCARIAVMRRPLSGLLYLGWIGAGLILLFIAADELMSFHEHLSKPMRHAMDLDRRIFYIWALPYMLGIAVFAIFLIPWWLKLNSKLRIALLTAALVFVCGAVLFEVIGNMFFLHEEKSQTIADYGYWISTTFEEGLEMFGMALALRALLREQEGYYASATSSI